MPPHARPAVPADYATFLRLFPELRVADPVPTQAQFVDRMMTRVCILEDASLGPVGYAFSNRYGPATHVAHLVVDPRARGRRGGLVLLDAVRARAVAEGCTEWALNVKQDNVAAQRLYARAGFTVAHESWVLWTSFSQIDRLPAPLQPLEVASVAAGEDADFERALALPEGRIAGFRAASTVRLAGLREQGQPVGFVAFDPEFPRLFPFRVRDVSFARALAREVRAFAKEERVLVIVEAHPALHEAFVERGARLDHAIFRMTGPLT